MNAPVLLILNELWKRDKCKACRAFYCLFAARNKFNNAGARMLDSIIIISYAW